MSVDHTDIVVLPSVFEFTATFSMPVAGLVPESWGITVIGEHDLFASTRTANGLLSDYVWILSVDTSGWDMSETAEARVEVLIPDGNVLGSSPSVADAPYSATASAAVTVVRSPCASDPCGVGTRASKCVEAGLQSYTCACLPGFYGTECDEICPATHQLLHSGDRFVCVKYMPTATTFMEAAEACTDMNLPTTWEDNFLMSAHSDEEVVNMTALCTYVS